MLESCSKKDKIQEIITNLETKIAYHRENSNSALQWYNANSIVNVILSGAQALAMVIMGSLSIDNTDIAITSAVFTFFIMIINRIQASFQYNVLSVQHNVIGDNLNELCQDFKLIQEDPERMIYYQLYINRMISISQVHLQSVRKCWVFNIFCCF